MGGRAGAGQYQLSHLEALEAQSVHIMREVVAEFERPVLLFSGGKDSVVMLRLAEKAFWPARLPFPVMHVDTGHNFPEVLDFRDRRVAELDAQLKVASVQESIDSGRVVEEPGPNPSRNRLQTRTLLDAITEHRFDAVFGGARRDEEKARAKERVYSFRDEFGQWDPKNQRPELWGLFNGRHRSGEHIRVFPLSDWTELDIWQYIAQEHIEVPSIYFSHRRTVFRRDGMLLAVNQFVTVARRRGALRDQRPLPHRRRHDVHRGGGVHGRDRRRDHRRDGGVPAHRARCHPGRRPLQRGVDGGPQARGLLLDMELLRFATAGSVDDGKSTLIGRLLYDSKAIFEDQLEAVERLSRQRGDEYTDLALLTDGLRAEREQGITIDVAYRYFATPLRKFIIADTPGHIQYTRNMVTGNSTADLTLVLVDARKGIVEQTRRHAFLASLLRVPHLLVCVNKMDLVDYDEAVFTRIREEFKAFATRLEVTDLAFIPISALHGDNVVQRSLNMTLVRGPVAAAPPRAGLHRLGPQPDRPPPPRAVGGAAHGVDRARLPRLRRAGGRRGVPARGRGPGAAVGPHHHDRGHRHLRRSRGRGLRAHVGDGPAGRGPRRLAWRPHLPSPQPAHRGPGHRRHAVLDGRPPLGRGRRGGPEAHDPLGAGPGATRPLRPGREHAAPRRLGQRAAPQRRGPGEPAGHPAVVLRQLPAQPLHGVVRRRRRGHQRHGRAPA